MPSDVIYEEPKNLNPFQLLKKLWVYAPIYSIGWNQEFIDKKINGGAENGWRVQARPEQAREVQETAVAEPRQEVPRSDGAESPAKQKLSFYDFKTKQKFDADDYEIVEKETKTGKKRHFAVATSPSGGKSWRAMKK